MRWIKRLWCGLAGHRWQLYYFVVGNPLESLLFLFHYLANSDIACGRCGTETQARLEERGKCLMAVPAHWPEKAVPDWIVERLRNAE